MSEPRFGDRMRGIYASDSNPQREGFFVETVQVQRTKCYRLTDGKGNFWTYPVDSCQPVESGPTVASEQAEQAWTAYINSHDHGSSRRDAFLAGWQAGRIQQGDEREIVARWLWEHDDEVSDGSMQDASWDAATDMRAGYYAAADDLLARLAGGKQGVSLDSERLDYLQHMMRDRDAICYREGDEIVPAPPVTLRNIPDLREWIDAQKRERETPCKEDDSSLSGRGLAQ